MTLEVAHPFVFEAGLWEGEGTISFSMAQDELKFSSLWKVNKTDDGEIHFTQEINVHESPDKMENHFCLKEIKTNTFVIELENQLVGKVQGKGVIETHIIAWEFRETGEGFEGFEIYEKTSSNSYKMRAEFTAGAGLRTYIKGTLWKS